MLPKDNLARVYSRLGDYEKALSQYNAYLDIFYSGKVSQSDEAGSTEQVKSVYFNLGRIHAELGQDDEGACLASNGTGGADAWRSFSIYVRFLLELGMYSRAATYQDEIINANQGAPIPAAAFLDQAATAILTGDRGFAMDRAMTQMQNMTARPQDLAAAIAIHSLSGQWNTPVGLPDVQDIESVIDIVMLLCPEGLTFGEGYLPKYLVEQLGRTFERICEYGNKRSTG
jgi:tetratricopeptide (TPR) repeat protein